MTKQAADVETNRVSSHDWLKTDGNISRFTKSDKGKGKVLPTTGHEGPEGE